MYRKLSENVMCGLRDTNASRQTNKLEDSQTYKHADGNTSRPYRIALLLQETHYVPPTRQKIGHFSSPQPISWLSTEKLNQTQRKQTCIYNKIQYNTKLNKLTQKTTARFGCLLRPGNG